MAGAHLTPFTRKGEEVGKTRTARCRDERKEYADLPTRARDSSVQIDERKGRKASKDDLWLGRWAFQSFFLEVFSCSLAE